MKKERTNNNNQYVQHGDTRYGKVHHDPMREYKWWCKDGEETKKYIQAHNQECENLITNIFQKVAKKQRRPYYATVKC